MKCYCLHMLTNDDIKKIESALQPRFDKIDERFNQIDQHISKIDKKFEARLNKMDKKLDKHFNHLEARTKKYTIDAADTIFKGMESLFEEHATGESYRHNFQPITH